jgi:parallel beta-helix repeat protein
MANNYVAVVVGVSINPHSDNSTISGNNITNNEIGVVVDSSSGNTVFDNNLKNNDCGVYIISYSICNVIAGNNITSNNDIWADFGIGVYLRTSSNNTISTNIIAANFRAGICFVGSSDNTVSGNNITNNNDYGIVLSSSSNNRFCHNDFIDNNQQVGVSQDSSDNLWDDGYPSGGNYWSDYDGVDSDPDGIGDTEYVIDADSVDNYPLMGMFSDFNATLEYHVQTICNSTLSDFQFNGTAIRFNVSGENGTTGFCRICIPKTLMNDAFRVFVNSTEILPPPEPLPCSDATHNYLYFNYTHSTQEVIIIPEFPSFLIPSLFMIATLIVVIFCGKKHIDTNRS